MSQTLTSTSSRKANKRNTIRHKEETLFAKESQHHFHEPFGISTVTFFEGTSNVAYEEVYSHIRERLRLVLQANPWVAGKIIPGKGGHKVLWYENRLTDALIDEILDLEMDAGLAASITEQTPYEELIKSCSSLCVPSGSVCMEKEKRICRAVIVPGEGSNTLSFAFVFSMSHVAVDGHTYYAILNMLADATVMPMSSHRKMEFEEHEDAFYGREDYAWTRGLAKQKALFWGKQSRKKGRALAYYVDPEKIAAAKRSAPTHAGTGADAAGLEYVSTNDIITSYFGQATSARLLMMSINYRGRGQRLANIGSGDAGNYEGVVLYDRDGFASAGKIRQSLQAGMPFRRTGTKSLPGLCGSCRLVSISSWAFSKFDFQGLGVKQKLHIPLANVDIEHAPMDYGIIFRPQPDTLGVLYIGKRCGVDELKGQGSVLAGTIHRDMFPGTRR